MMAWVALIVGVRYLNVMRKGRYFLRTATVFTNQNGASIL